MAVDRLSMQFYSSLHPRGPHVQGIQFYLGNVGSEFSVKLGHYFANPRNRFWAALNRSGLVDQEMAPQNDAGLLHHGIGFTDVAKRPTRQGSGLNAADFQRWAPVFKAKLLQYNPLILLC